jgi:scyllo-inositol 2-dehydrogenase (NADP+)
MVTGGTMKTYKKSEEVTIGVIGYGGAFNMGQKHLQFAKEAGMTPVAVCELDPERLKVAETDFPGIGTYSTVEAMLKESSVELIIIITPHNTHAKLALQCLKAGRHVISEKPLALSTEDCDAMIAAAEETGVMLSTYHNRHWDGCIVEAMEKIRKERIIGDIYRIEAHMGAWREPKEWWRDSKSISGGIQYDWGVHLLEYSLQLLEGRLTEVSGFAKKGYWNSKSKWGDDATEDEGFLTARFDDGTWLTLNNTNLDMNPKREDRGALEITGTEGSYIMDMQEYKIITRKKDKIKTIKGKNRENAHGEFYKNIAEYLTGQAELVITPQLSRRPIHILDLADRSVKSGQAQKAQYP